MNRAWLSGALGFSFAGLVFGLAAAQFSAGFGLGFPSAPVTLPVSLAGIGVMVLLASIPIYRYRKASETYKTGPRPARPNPFYAVRVLVLARASSLTGWLFLGWHFGLIIWLLGFTTAPSALLTGEVFGLLGALVLTVLGEVSRRNCKTPKDPDGEVRS